MKIALSAGKSLNFNANCIVLSRTPKEKKQTQKDAQGKIIHVVKN